MRQLILFRHAKATPSQEDADDFERALTQTGIEDARRVAARITSEGMAPLAVLVSTARRTQETWAAIAPLFPPATVRFEASLYLGEAETLLNAAAKAGVDRVMVVAHNPGLQDLALSLCPLSDPALTRLQDRLPTASAVVFERESEKSLWRLRLFATPADTF